MSKNALFIVTAGMVGLKSPMPDGRQFARNGERVSASQINVKWLLESGAVIADGTVEEMTDTGRKSPPVAQAPEPPKTFGWIVAKIAEVRPIAVETVIRAKIEAKSEPFDLDEALAAAKPFDFSKLTEEDQDVVREIAAGTTGLDFDEPEIERVATDPVLFKARMAEIGSRKTKNSVEALKDEYRAYLTRLAA